MVPYMIKYIEKINKDLAVVQLLSVYAFGTRMGPL